MTNMQDLKTEHQLSRQPTTTSYVLRTFAMTTNYPTIPKTEINECNCFQQGEVRKYEYRHNNTSSSRRVKGRQAQSNGRPTRKKNRRDQRIDVTSLRHFYKTEIVSDKTSSCFMNIGYLWLLGSFYLVFIVLSVPLP